MSGSNSSRTTNQNLDHAIAGGITGFTTRFLCQPLDVIKIRFQLQVEPVKFHPISKYRSLLQGFCLIYKEEGILALWKGHVPAQLLSVLYGTIQFYGYHKLMRISVEHMPSDKWMHSKEFVAGTISSCAATILTFPFDTLRTRLVAQSDNHRVYRGMLHSCTSILLYESPKTLFYGLSPQLIQVAPHAGLQFMLYTACTDTYKKCFDQTDIDIYNSMISGSIAGFAAKTIVYPLDLSRKRLQIQGFRCGRKGFGKFFQCNGLTDCIRRTVKEEGVVGLYKGLIPSQLKATLTTALYFTGYQQSLKLIATLRSQE